jgi:AraC family transcriptional regulator
MSGALRAAATGGVLRGGEFFSKVVKQDRRQDVVLSELWQPLGGTLPRHEHEVAYVTLVLEGNYAETGPRGWTELAPFTAIFNPSGVAHASQVGVSGTRLFTIECWPRLLEGLDLRLPGHPVADPGSGGMLWTGLSLFSAFTFGTAEPLVLESHLAEMLGALAGTTVVATGVPPWFRRVKDRVHAEFREPIRVRDLATDAGIHPVHLARVFRAQERQSLGGYVQRLRIRAACELLRSQDTPLAMVAAECGFADQSHLTRTFRRIVGATPARFRRALRPPAPRRNREREPGKSGGRS